jgi:hypothetical protein
MGAHRSCAYDPMGERLLFTDKDTKEKPVSEKPTKVRVSDRVVHEGKPYTKGDTLTVPEHVAEEWERSRWSSESPRRSESSTRPVRPSAAAGRVEPQQSPYQNQLR